MKHIEGDYTLKDEKLYSSDRPLILHVRRRKHIKKASQTPLFLAIHQPNFEYVSNLYHQPAVDEKTKRSHELPESCTLDLDYKGSQYQLVKNGNDVRIEKSKITKSGKYQAKELASV